jgi:hypothetical protein
LKGGKSRLGSSKAAATAANSRRRLLEDSGDVGRGVPAVEGDDSDPGLSGGGGSGSRGMDSCNVKELRTACGRLNLRVSGNRDALVARLEAELAKSGKDNLQVLTITITSESFSHYDCSALDSGLSSCCVHVLCPTIGCRLYFPARHRPGQLLPVVWVPSHGPPWAPVHEWPGSAI